MGEIKQVMKLIIIKLIVKEAGRIARGKYEDFFDRKGIFDYT